MQRMQRNFKAPVKRARNFAELNVEKIRTFDI